MDIPGVVHHSEGWIVNKTVEQVAEETAAQFRDLFAIHANIEDVKLAEDQLSEEIGASGMLDVDPLTLRIKARYLVADRMLRVRSES